MGKKNQTTRQQPVGAVPCHARVFFQAPSADVRGWHGVAFAFACACELCVRVRVFFLGATSSAAATTTTTATTTTQHAVRAGATEKGMLKICTSSFSWLGFDHSRLSVNPRARARAVFIKCSADVVNAPLTVEHCKYPSPSSNPVNNYPPRPPTLNMAQRGSSSVAKQWATFQIHKKGAIETLSG